MSLLFKIPQSLFKPDTIISGTSSLTLDDIGSALADDKTPEINLDIPAIDDGKKDKEPAKEDAEESKKDSKDVEEKEEEDDIDKELAELEEELEEPDEEKLELTTPVRRSEILKKYPEVFKDFPYLEKAYYREQQFTEVFPTIDEAKEAKKDTETLNNFEEELGKGDIKNILLAVKGNEKAFAHIADNLMSTLSEVDNNAYLHVVGNLLKNTIIDMVQEANNSKNDVLRNAAHILHQYAFGTSQWSPPTKMEKEERIEDRSKEIELQRREKELTDRHLNTHKSSLQEKVQNSIKNWIDQNIDPKDSMTPYVKRNASRESYESFESLLKRDARFKILVEKLWDASKKDNFSENSLHRIRGAYISRAKTLLPTVVNKARKEALKEGMGKRVREDDDESTSNKETPKRHEQSRSKNTSDHKRPEAGERTIDFLNRD